MNTRPMSAGGGLTNSKLALANAALSDVLSGKKFYSGNKTLKTGTMTNRGAWNGTYSGSDVTIPNGYHNGSGKVTVSGGNRGAWGATINPSGSITIPKGWHNGSGVVKANTAESVINIDAVETDSGWGDNGIKWQSPVYSASNRKIRVYVACRPDSGDAVNATLQLLGDGNVIEEVALTRNSMNVMNVAKSGYSNYQLRINQTYHAGNGIYQVRGTVVRY